MIQLDDRDTWMQWLCPTTAFEVLWYLLFKRASLASAIDLDRIKPLVQHWKELTRLFGVFQQVKGWSYWKYHCLGFWLKKSFLYTISSVFEIDHTSVWESDPGVSPSLNDGRLWFGGLSSSESLAELQVGRLVISISTFAYGDSGLFASTRNNLFVLYIALWAANFLNSPDFCLKTMSSCSKVRRRVSGT